MDAPPQACAGMSSKRKAGLSLCCLLALGGLGGSAWRIATEGPGVLGINNHVPWGWDIVQFVFWIGLGHAGTLISAILLLTHQRWRLGIARHAELMTLCAILTAAVFPLVHVGRIWMQWQLTPTPVASGVWPNLASPLVWDCAAIGSYLLLSALYWWMGMYGEQPLAPNQRALWARACTLMAGILTTLVVTVHSVVGCDFAATLRWHATWLPPYFVCGALLSGMAAVQLIALARSCNAGIIKHLATLTLGLGLAMGLFYAIELSQEPGIWNLSYLCMLLLNLGLPSLYAFPQLRRNRPVAGLISCGILVGMWLERGHIIIGRSLALTGGTYSPTQTDIAMLLGSIGLFLFLFALLSYRMPPETQEPLDIPPPSQPTVEKAGFLGTACGLTASLLWFLATQDADTAGVLAGRPHGFFFSLPALFVCGLLGAGLGILLAFLRHLRL